MRTVYSLTTDFAINDAAHWYYVPGRQTVCVVIHSVPGWTNCVHCHAVTDDFGDLVKVGER